MAQVELLLSPLPSHVRTARMVAVAAARRAGLQGPALDEVRLAVGEACLRAVGVHALHAPDVPVRLTLNDDPTGLELTVIDAGPGSGPVSDDPASDLLSFDAPDEPASAGGSDVAYPDVALAVLRGLVDDVNIDALATGTSVTLRWPLPTGAGPGSTVLA